MDSLETSRSMSSRRQIKRSLRRLAPVIVAGGLITALSAHQPLLGLLAMAAVQSIDSTLVYGSMRCTADVGYTLTEDVFTADTVLGKRYVLELRGGTGLTNVKVVVDSQQWVAENDGTTLTRVIDVGTTGSHDLKVWVKGSIGSWADCRISYVRDSTYIFYGPTFHVRPSTGTATDYYTIDPPSGQTPYTMRMINGNPNGTSRATSSSVSIKGSSVLSSSFFTTGIATKTVTVSLTDTSTVAAFKGGASLSRYKLQFFAQDRTAPALTLTSPATSDTVFTTSYKTLFAGSVADETPGWLTLTKTMLWVADTTRPWIATPGSFSDSIPLPQGRHRIRVQVTNSPKLTTTEYRWIVRDNVKPTLTINWPRAVSPPDSTTDAVLTIAGRYRDSTWTTVTLDGDTIDTGYGDSLSCVYPLDIGMNRLRFVATDQLGNRDTLTRYFMRSTGTERGGPDVDESELSNAKATPFYESVAFLFTGDDAIQTDISGGALPVDSVGVIRGHVIGRDYGPIANVTVGILGHPEFGTTLTRNDGMFDLAVKGGQQYTVRLTKAQYLEAQRKVMPPMNDFALLDDVALIGVTARFTAVDLDDPIVARSRFSSDANGDRDMRIIFRPGTRARIPTAAADTTKATFSAIRVRATEYSVGADGPESMPGELPPSSAYTYCVDLRTDEADSLAALAGVPHFSTYFTDTVSCYVRNFLHFPVGSYVPIGFYDSDQGKWISEDDGVVLAIIGTAGLGLVVDTDSIPGADTPGRLDSLGITDNELQQLRTQFGVGDTLWRIRTAHFSRPDANVMLAGVLSALSRAGSRAVKFALELLKPCLGAGSIIECESRVLRERIPIAGTPYSLNYRSARAPGDLAVKSLHVQVYADPPPSNLDRAIVRLDIAGKRIEVVDNTPNVGDVVDVVWDGRDAYGRKVTGSAVGRLAVGYQYRTNMWTGNGGNSWANPSLPGVGVNWVGADRSDGLISWRYQRVILGADGAGSAGLGGWTLSPHHFYDPKGNGTLYMGDGSVISGESMPPTMTHVAGSDPCSPCSLDDATATSAPLQIRGVAQGPEGNLYIAENLHGSIYRLGTDGILRRIAGTGTSASFDTSGHRVAALSCGMSEFTDLAVAPDGTVYFSTRGEGATATNNIVGRITRDGYVEKLIGGNFYGDSWGDGGDVSKATIRDPRALAFGPDGSLFICDMWYSPERARIRRVAPDGLITAYAGDGATTLATAPERAIDLTLSPVRDMCVDAEGNLFVSEDGRTMIWSITRDGQARILLQTGALSGNQRLAPAPDGGLYVGDPNAGRVLTLDADSTLSVIAGGGTLVTGNGVPALKANTIGPTNVIPSIHNDGSYYVVVRNPSNNADQIFRIARALAIPSGDELAVADPTGSQVFYFTAKGQHIRTRDALTGAQLGAFTYDDNHQLHAIYDVNGDSTVVTRDDGVPTAITGPFGQVTSLTLDGSQHLEVVAFNSEPYELTTSSDGLLETFEDPEGHVHSFTYDETGRLTEDEDPEGHAQTLPTPDPPSGGNRSNDHFSPLDRKTTYEVTSDYDGTTRRKVTGPRLQGVGRNYFFSVDSAGKVYSWTPDRLARQETISPDPRFGMIAAFPAKTVDWLPSGARRTVEVIRSSSPTNFSPPAINGSWTEFVVTNGDTLRRDFIKTSGQADTLKVRSPEGRVVRTVTDGAGRPRCILVPGLDSISVEYDIHGRPIVSKQGNRVWLFGYDNQGHLSFVRDTLHRMTEFEYNGSGRMTSQLLPGAREIQLDYNTVGDLRSVTTPLGGMHSLAYTRTSLNTRYTPPSIAGVDSVSTTYDFNDDRQLVRVIRPGGSVLSLKYDGASGRLDSVSVARGLSGLYYATATGLLDSLSSPDTVTVSYEHNGPVLASEQWSGRLPGAPITVSRTKDRYFRDSTESITGAVDVAFDYDSDGLLVGAGDLDIHRRTDNGAIDSTHIAANGGAIESSLDYDAAGDVRNIRFRHTSVGVVFNQSISRDELGRVARVDETAFGTRREWSYRYDEAGRLYGVTLAVNSGTVDTVATYLYDNNGNRVLVRGSAPGDTASSTYDGQDRLLRYRNVRYEYTPAGDLARRIDGGDSTTYVYDALGNLLSVRADNGNTVSYVMDGANRRVGRKVDGQWTDVRVYANPLRAAAEFDANGAIRRRYIYGAEGLSPSVVMRGDTTFRVIVDYLGSVRAFINVDDGSVSRVVAYDPWGKPVGPGSSGMGYAGGECDSTTGLVRFGARDYDPESGRWITKDPVNVAATGINLYRYAANDPVSNRDESGQIVVPIVGAVVGAMIGGLTAAQGGGSSQDICRSAVVGAVLGAIPIPGMTGVLSNALVGSGLGLVGNVATAAATGHVDELTVRSVALSMIAGAIGGAAGAGVAGIRAPSGRAGYLEVYGFRYFSDDLGMPLVNVLVGGPIGGAVDALLHPPGRVK